MIARESESVAAQRRAPARRVDVCLTPAGVLDPSSPNRIRSLPIQPPTSQTDVPSRSVARLQPSVSASSAGKTHSKYIAANASAFVQTALSKLPGGRR